MLREICLILVENPINCLHCLATPSLHQVWTAELNAVTNWCSFFKHCRGFCLSPTQSQHLLSVDRLVWSVVHSITLGAFLCHPVKQVFANKSGVFAQNSIWKCLPCHCYPMWHWIVPLSCNSSVHKVYNSDANTVGPPGWTGDTRSNPENVFILESYPSWSGSRCRSRWLL